MARYERGWEVSLIALSRFGFVGSCLWSLWAVGAVAMFALFGWPESFLRWPHRSPAIDGIPLWYLGVSLLAVGAPLAAYLLGIRFSAWLVWSIFAVWLLLFLGYGYWSIALGLQFLLPAFFRDSLLRKAPGRSPARAVESGL